jgi:AAA+ superfamily predicted ATPase
MSATIHSKEYKFGVDYEVVCELISGEVAHHFSQLYELGENSALGALHLKSMDALQQIRDTLNPNDPETVRIALLALDAMRADREQVVSFALTNRSTQDKRQFSGVPIPYTHQAATA